MSRPGEDDLIATYFAPLAGAGALGLRDDAALLRHAPGDELVVTVDALVAGVHFFPDDPPHSIAVKALGVNLSDLAAKGAAPAGFLLALALPGDWTVSWLQTFCAGLGETAAAHGCPLLGGDTVRTPGPLSVSITAFGTVPQGRMVQRTTARPGNLLYVSGTIGDAALGLALRSGRPLAGLGEDEQAFLVDRYRRPQPRVALAAALRAHARAAMDVSDGLVGDASKMLRASAVSGLIDVSRVPLSAAGRAAVEADPALLLTAVTGGDDYEILVAVPPPAAAAFAAAATGAGVRVTAIGHVEAGGAPLAVVDATGAAVPVGRGSFSHF